VRDDKAPSEKAGCLLYAPGTKPSPCVYGDPDTSTTVVSSATARGAVVPDRRGDREERGWRLVVMTKISRFVDLRDGLAASLLSTTECYTWRDRVVERLRAGRRSRSCRWRA
jgi:hypothetical protein